MPNGTPLQDLKRYLTVNYKILQSYSHTKDNTMNEKSFKQTKLIFQIFTKKRYEMEVKLKLKTFNDKKFTYICIDL